MRSPIVVALSLVLLACDNPTDVPLGELQGGIISGREQSVQAGATQLPEPVVNQVVRAPSGQIVVRRVHRANFNGTVVNGSPVPGAVVCVYDQDKDLVPFSRCTNTDALGKATFFFTPPTTAGNYIARINGSVTTNGVLEATTFDTVKAEVQAQTRPDSSYRSTDVFGATLDPFTSPARVYKNGVLDKFGNQIDFRITPDARLTPRDTVIGGDSSRYVAFVSVPEDTVVHATVMVGHNETPLANLWYRIREVNGVPTLRWTICGFKLTCTIP